MAADGGGMLSTMAYWVDVAELYRLDEIPSALNPFPDLAVSDQPHARARGTKNNTSYLGSPSDVRRMPMQHRRIVPPILHLVPIRLRHNNVVAVAVGRVPKPRDLKGLVGGWREQ